MDLGARWLPRGDNNGKVRKESNASVLNRRVVVDRNMVRNGGHASEKWHKH